MCVELSESGYFRMDAVAARTDAGACILLEAIFVNVIRFRKEDTMSNNTEGMTDKQYASWLRLLSLNLTMIKGIDDPTEFSKALHDLTECLRAGLEDELPEDLEEMTREEMQRFVNLLAAEGKSELEAYRLLGKVIGVEYPTRSE